MSYPHRKSSHFVEPSLLVFSIVLALVVAAVTAHDGNSAGELQFGTVIFRFVVIIGLGFISYILRAIYGVMYEHYTRHYSG